MATQVSSLKAKKISQLDDYSINDGLSSNIDESIYLILAHSNNNENVNTNYKLSFNKLVTSIKKYILDLINSRDIKSNTKYIEVTKNIDPQNGVQDYELSLLLSENSDLNTDVSDGLVTGSVLNFVTNKVDKKIQEVTNEVSYLNNSLSDYEYKTNKNISNIENEIDNINDKIYETTISKENNNFIDVEKIINENNKIIDYKIKIDMATDLNPLNDNDGLMSKKQVYEMMNDGTLKWNHVK